MYLNNPYSYIYCECMDFDMGKYGFHLEFFIDSFPKKTFSRLKNEVSLPLKL